MKSEEKHKFQLQKFLKRVKLNENEISMFFGALVVIVTGILVVNYFKDKKAGLLTDTSTNSSVKEVHVVTRGETLWSIAENTFGSGYNWVDIYKANGLKSENIEVGQKLTIPDSTPKQPTSTKHVLTKAVVDTIAGESYTVAKGDKLWDIAVRAYGDGYKWVEIAKANNLANPDLIHVGNILKLPR